MNRYLPSRSEYYFNDDTVSVMDLQRDQGKKRLRNRFTSAPVVMNTPNVLDPEEYKREWGDSIEERGARIYYSGGVRPLRELFGSNQFRSGNGIPDGEYRNAVKQKDIGSGLTGVGIDDKYLVSSQKLTGGRKGEQQVFYFVETQYNSIRWSLKDRSFADPKNARKHCTCTDFTNHRNNEKYVCKHIVAVQFYEAYDVMREDSDDHPLKLVNDMTETILTPEDGDEPTTEVISMEENLSQEDQGMTNYERRQESIYIDVPRLDVADDVNEDDEYRFSQDSLRGSQ